MNNLWKTIPRIRVLVVDDSVVSQRVYQHILSGDDRFELVGTAANGQEAIEAVARLKPDVVSMDINMPVMDGVEATRLIMQKHPVPVVVASSLYNPPQQEIAFRVLEAGAVNIIPKPVGPGHPDYLKLAKRYLSLLRSMSEVKVVRRNNLTPLSTPGGDTATELKDELPKYAHRSYKILAIGASAGGPESTKNMLSQLDTTFPLPVVLLQHIDPGFTNSYHQWLQSYSGIPLILVEREQIMLPGKGYLAPGNRHLVVRSEGVITLSDDPPEKGHRPAVSKLFSSIAKVYGRNCMAVLLSGMGTDGALEMKTLKDLGALTFAQNQASCLVYGMPGEAVRLGGVVAELSPLNIVIKIKQILNQQ